MRIGKATFISYRTGTLSSSMKENCAIFWGGDCNRKNRMYEKCKQIECSYRQCNALRKLLIDEGVTDDCFIMPPSAILPPNVALCVLDFFEQMISIYDVMYKTDSFIRFNIAEHNDSFWTLLEREIWRRHNSNPVEFHVNPNNDNSVGFEGPCELTPMSKSGITVLTRIRSYIINEPKSAGHFWGRYTRSTVVVKCTSCSTHYLISRRVAKHLIENKLHLFCQSCGKAKFEFSKTPFDHLDVNVSKGWSLFYQCISEYCTDTVSPLDTDRMINVLLDDSNICPEAFPLICFHSESFRTEGSIAIDFIVPPIGIAKYTYRCMQKILSHEDDHIELRYRNERNEVQIISLN